MYIKIHLMIKLEVENEKLSFCFLFNHDKTKLKINAVEHQIFLD